LIPALDSLGERLFERFVQLEQILVKLESQPHEPLAPANPPDQRHPLSVPSRLDPERSAILASLHDLQQRMDRILFLHALTRVAGDPMLCMAEIIGTMMDALWHHEQFAYGCIILGASELGPYQYQDLRGVLNPQRYLGKKCPLPLWGELARALVRRLNPEEADYLVIDDIAATGRPTVAEFPWLPRAGSLIILPLRKESVAIGALLLGKSQASAFHDPDLCVELVEFCDTLARAVVNVQTREELEERAEQLVGLQLFTRSIALPASLEEFLPAAIKEIAELMGASSVLFAFRHTRLRPQLRQLLEEIPGVLVFENLFEISVVSSSEPLPVFAVLYPLLVWVSDAGQPLFFDSTQRTQSPEDLYYNEVGTALIVPVASGDIVLGSLYVESSEARSDFDEGDMVVLRTAANAVAMALDRIA